MNSPSRSRRIRVSMAFAAAALAAIAAPGASASPSASYEGPGVNENGLLKLTTGTTGNVASYDAYWRRKVCGIPDFSIRFWTDDASQELPTGGDGSFFERFSFTYKSRGKKYRVRATSEGGFATFNQDPAVNPDQVSFKQTVKVKRVKKGARWCKAKAHSWIGYRQ